MPPALLIEKIVSIEEVVELFALFFDQCHRQCPILDPEIHTPTITGSRSPFLFTCSTSHPFAASLPPFRPNLSRLFALSPVCSVAARYYTKRTDDLYRKCLRVAKRAAFDVMFARFFPPERFFLFVNVPLLFPPDKD